jgi:hypothetical protein
MTGLDKSVFENYQAFEIDKMMGRTLDRENPFVHLAREGMQTRLVESMFGQR